MEEQKKSYFLQGYRWFIVLACFLILSICFIYLSFSPVPFKIGGINDPKAESSKAQKIMTDKLSLGSSSIYVLYESRQLSPTSSAFESEVKNSLAGLKKFKLEHSITSPYQNDRQIAPGHHAAYATITLDESVDVSAGHMQKFRDALGKTKILSTFIGGMPSFIADIKRISETDLFRAEMIAFPLSIIALIFVFGSVIAAFLPILCGVITVTITISILFFLGHRYEFTIYVLNIASMLGLGLSLDYTLLMVSRFREELNKNDNKYRAIKRTLATAGKTVLFSGLTVLISLISLIFFPENILYSIGIGGVTVVIISILIALIFLPALLALLGKKVNAWPLPLLPKKVTYENVDHSFLFRMAMGIMRHPMPIFLLTIAFLLTLGFPILNAKINRPDARILPPSAESRKFLEKFSTQFNVDELSPIFVVAKSKNNSILTANNIASLYNFSRRLQGDSRIKRVDSIVTTDTRLKLPQYQHLYQQPSSTWSESQKQLFKKTTKGPYTVFTIISKYPMNDPQTYALIREIRHMTLNNNITIQITGDSAITMDTIKSIYSHFFKTIIIISIITYLLLLILLRSVILPLKALLMNFSSLMVCYGMLVFIYQEGHFRHLLHFKTQGFTDLDLPILLFCALFGLSMDYEIFLLTRVKEFYDQTGDNTLSVARGLERSARIITSAALIVVLVSLAFVTAEIVFIKAFGLATALAVLVDATVIRLLLVPSTMRLLGKWNWYLPKWLDRILPKSIE